MKPRTWQFLAVALAGLATLACDRADVWDRSLEAGDGVALEQLVVWPLAGREELVLYSPTSNVVEFESLAARPRQVVAGPDGRSVLALDEAGGVTLLRFEKTGARASRTDYMLGALFTGVELAADGHYAVFHHGGSNVGDTGGETIRNPNEIAILDLTKPGSANNPTRRTLRSFGAGPRAIVLSDPGAIGGETRRLAWALSDRYLAVFDLAHPKAREVVVHLTLPNELREVVPVSVQAVPAVDGGLPGALVAAAGTDNLFLLGFDTESPADEVPKPVLNALPGGNGLSDTLPLVTPAGLRIFTLAGRQLAAVNPGTGGLESVTLPAPGAHLVPFEGADGAQQALVWSEGSATVAFVRLDEVEQARGRAVTILTLEDGIGGLLPIPGRAAAVAISPSRLVVLDFREQTATPFDLGGSVAGMGDYYYDDYGNRQTSGPDAVLISPDGKHLYAEVDAAAPMLVSIDLDTGAAGATELTERGSLLLVPGAKRLVVDHHDPFGAATVVPTGSLVDAEPKLRTGLFLTEVLDQ